MKPFNYYDLIEAFGQPGCAVCTLTTRDVARFLDSHLYEYVITSQTTASIRASRGLCATHSVQLADYGASVLGVAILQSHVLDEVLKITAQTTPKAGTTFNRLLGRGNASSAAMSESLEAVGECMACEALERAQKSHLGTLSEHLNDPQLEAAFRGSEGVCLPHFRALLEITADVAIVERLVSIQTTHWKNLKAELDLFADKYDINHADQSMGEEGDSWRRALRLIAGDQALFGRQPR